jgi:hypothetical protein
LPDHQTLPTRLALQQEPIDAIDAELQPPSVVLLVLYGSSDFPSFSSDQVVLDDSRVDFFGHERHLDFTRQTDRLGRRVKGGESFRRVGCDMGGGDDAGDVLAWVEQFPKLRSLFVFVFVFFLFIRVGLLALLQ